jgi:integrase
MPKPSKGWLRRKAYVEGEVWLFCYYVFDSGKQKRVERSKVIGLASDFPDEHAAWRQAENLEYWKLLDAHLSISPTFGEIAQHWRKNDLKKSGAIGKRASETITTHESMLDGYVLPKWGEVRALDMAPVDIETWFEELSTSPDCRKYPEGQEPPKGRKPKPLEWPSIQKIRSVMSLVFAHALRHKLLPVEINSNPFRNPKTEGGVRCIVTSDYEATVVTAEQMISILEYLDTPTTQMEWMMALFHAATGLRPEEGFGVKWGDIDWEKGQINLRRAWSKGKETPGKNRPSMVPVAMHPVLAGFLLEWRKQSPYPKDDDWLFPSLKLKGEKPRSASIAAQDYLRPAAVHAGAIEAGSSKRFGWHNLRHSLAEFLAGEVDPVVTMKILRHIRLATTAEIYTHHVSKKQQAAQGLFLKAIGKTEGRTRRKKEGK